MKSYDKQRLIREHSPRSPILKNLILAFISGGAVCSLGELMLTLFFAVGCERALAQTLVSCTLIIIAAVLTALGAFDTLARHTGAGTLVPITGFSNAVVSEAMDSSYEGYVLGVGAKIFTVAGPVLLYGMASGAVYGVIYFVAGVLF